MTFVLDNSVSMRWCFAGGGMAELAYADRVLDSLEEQQALVPGLWPLEVANVLSRAEAQKRLTVDTSSAFLAQLRALRIEVDATTPDHAFTGILEISRRYRLSAYDAAYLELAMRRQLPLATLDSDLRRAAKRIGVDLF